MRRRAITLVEVAVILAVIAVIIALLLPSVQHAKDSARREECLNHLRNLGLAVTTFSIRKGSYPESSTTWPERSLNHSWQMLTLQDLECNPFPDLYNFDVENFAPENRSVTSQRLSIYLCPSNPLSTAALPSEKILRVDGTTYPPGSEFARSHYAANWGGGRLPGYGGDFARTVGNFRGLIMTIPAPTPNAPPKRIRPADVTDGLATTIMLGEKRDSQGWAVGGYAGSEFDAATSPIPPDRPDVRMVVSGSYHPGIANFAFADGTVRSLRGTINRKVWYASLTRDGGEVVSRDDY